MGTAHTPHRAHRRRTHPRRGRRISALAAGAAALTALGAASATATGAPAAGGDGTGGEQQQQQRKRIASSVLGHDYKITLTALRSADTPPDEPPAASVRMQAFTYQDGAWRESDRVTVGEVGGWFWHPLTGSHAVCTFSTSGSEPAPIEVGLLLTPSLGCSPTESFRLIDGRFHRG